MEPQTISKTHNFGITPFGVYCLDCCVPIGNHENERHLKESIRKHCERNKHRFTNGNTATLIARELRKNIYVKFGHVRDYSAWITKRNIRRFGCTCGESFKRRANMERHISTAEKKNYEGVHSTRIFSAVETICERIIDENKIIEMSEQPVHKEVTSVQSEENISDSKKYIRIESNNRKWLTMSLTKVKDIFEKYKRPNESLDPYLTSLKLITIQGNRAVIGRIKDSLSLVEKNDRSMNGSTLNFLLDCCKKWIEDFCREHVNMLDGKSRFKLQSFFDESMLVNSGCKMNFNMREKEEVVLNETLLVIELSWKLHEQGLYNTNITERIQDIKNGIQNIEQQYNAVVSDEAMEEMIGELYIQRYIHSILVEKKLNAYHLLIGHHIVILRLFKMKRDRVNGKEERFLSMRRCGDYGSIISLHLHIYRLASASLMACTNADSWNLILEEVSNAPLCHILSPLINKTREMENRKINVRIKKVKDNGDIVVDDYTFPKILWSQLVPKLNEAFEETLELILIGDKWKCITNVSNAITVERIEEHCFDDSNDILHYKFNVNVNGRVVDETDLQLYKEIHNDTFEKLSGLVMISLQGTGLGSARVAELYRIQMHQVQWKRKNFYYVTESKKRGKAGSSSNKVVTHKLPISISRYLLLYDFIGRQVSKGREEFLFNLNDDTVKKKYDNQYFYTEFAKIFKLSSNCTALIMRHLYTQITNYLFPRSGNNFEYSTVSTIDTIAEMSGHSALTHQQYYASTINEEVFYDTYHRNIGSLEILLDCDNTIISTSTESDILHCLQVILGCDATFMSNLQKNLLLDTCNNQFKHTFCSVGCGGGKSMGWVIPMVRQILMGQRPKMSIVIVPYCFLLDHHISSCASILGHCNRISIAALKGSNIESNEKPFILRDIRLLPSILFVSLEGIAKLVEFHFEYMKELMETQSVFKIYLDECHTVLSELSFRKKYVSLKKLAALKVPVVSFSGSFQQSFVNGYMNYMFGSTKEEMFNYVIDADLFGKKLLRIQHNASNNYIENGCDFVLDFMKTNPNDNIHIIVSTKKEGKYD